MSRSEVVEALRNPSVASVDAYNARMTNVEKEKLIYEYPEVKFGFTFVIWDHKVRTDDTAFVTAHSNKSERHTSEIFRWLAHCKELRVLDLAHNKIDDLSFLAPLTELRILLLGDNRIEDLSVLGELPNLEYVELFKNRVRDLTPIKKLTNLLDLNLCFNWVENFSPLYGLGQLERLWLYSSQGPNKEPAHDAVVRLRRELDTCLIDTTSYSTLGGWREHFRWYVVRNMTRRAYTWLPWSSDGYTQELVFVPQQTIDKMRDEWYNNSINRGVV